MEGFRMGLRGIAWVLPITRFDYLARKSYRLTHLRFSNELS
jgi:hypothetical protein